MTTPIGIADLMGRLALAGFTVELTASGPRLVKTETGARLPQELLVEVKARRGDIIAHLSGDAAGDPDEEACAVCGRITDAEDRDVLATNHYLCDRTECPSKVAARRAASRRSAA